MLKKSPLAPESFPNMPIIDGVKFVTASCGIKYKNRADVMMACFDNLAEVAGVFTKSTTASANVSWGRRILPHGKAKLLIVNSGNANAFNGKNGEESVARIAKHGTDIFGCKMQEVYPCSTGVIGEVLPDNLITSAFVDMKTRLSKGNWQEAAKAITTTDTYIKGATRTTKIDGTKVIINGIAKGSGMIAPNMATMLAYIFTNANIAAPALQQLLQEGVDKSFNCITVDSDTSTSDTALLFATCKARHKKIAAIGNKKLANFKLALEEVLLDLAHQVVKDGEGATKFITVNVIGAKNDNSAKNIAFSIANSPLVKTAIAGEDANWGRIIMAVGKTLEKVSRERIDVQMGDEIIVKQGQRNPKYSEQKVTEHLKTANINITVNLNIGKGKSTVWTCDLTHDYISINADYRS